MNHTWGTPETQPPEPPRTEYGYLCLGIAALTTALLLCAGSYEGFVTVGTGVFGILASMTVVGGVGWIVRSGDTKRRRDLRQGWAKLRTGQAEVHGQLAELTSAVEQLRGQLAHMPASPKQYQGARYVGAVALSDPGDTVPLMPKVDRPQPLDREAAVEEGFELGYRTKEAELKTVRLPQQKRRLTGDK